MIRPVSVMLQRFENDILVGIRGGVELVDVRLSGSIYQNKTKTIRGADAS